MNCAITIDLEDFIYTFDNNGNSSDKINSVSKIKLYSNSDFIINFLNKSNVKATFFILGKLAEHEPDLIKRIFDDGHEIACHGYDHKNLNKMTLDEFRIDLYQSIKAIYDACQIIPKGYRAPNFSMVKETYWALDILKEYDFTYDSSIQPFGYHPGYGDGTCSMTPFLHESGIIELPITCAEIFKIRVPCSGGAYFRFYPFKLFKYLLKKAINQGKKGIFYIHPWELSLQNSYYNFLNIYELRKNFNKEKTRDRLKMMLEDFNFITMKDLINNIDFSYDNRKY